MIELIHHFCKSDQGQDITEYTLLLAFVAFTAAIVFLNFGPSFDAIWNSTDNRLKTASNAIG